MEGRLSPVNQSFKEIQEETGIARSELRKILVGARYVLRRRDLVKVDVHPVLFESRTRRIKLNWENTGYQWVRIEDLSKFRLIPKFKLTLKALELE